MVTPIVASTISSKLNQSPCFYFVLLFKVSFITFRIKWCFWRNTFPSMLRHLMSISSNPRVTVSNRRFSYNVKVILMFESGLPFIFPYFSSIISRQFYWVQRMGENNKIHPLNNHISRFSFLFSSRVFFIYSPFPPIILLLRSFPFLNIKLFLKWATSPKYWWKSSICWSWAVCKTRSKFEANRLNTSVFVM